MPAVLMGEKINQNWKTNKTEDDGVELLSCSPIIEYANHNYSKLNSISIIS